MDKMSKQRPGVHMAQKFSYMTSAELQNLLERLDMARGGDAAVCATVGVPAPILKEGPFWLQQRVAKAARLRL